MESHQKVLKSKVEYSGLRRDKFVLDKLEGLTKKIYHSVCPTSGERGDESCSKSSPIPPPCEFTRASVNFIVEMSLNVQPFMIHYYEAVIREFLTSMRTMIPSQLSSVRLMAMFGARREVRHKVLLEEHYTEYDELIAKIQRGLSVEISRTQGRHRFLVEFFSY